MVWLSTLVDSAKYILVGRAQYIGGFSYGYIGWYGSVHWWNQESIYWLARLSTLVDSAKYILVGTAQYIAGFS